MKKVFYLVFLAVAMIILLSGCAPASTPISPTLPFVMPKGDFEMSWNIYNSKYNSSNDILTIRRQGSKYTEKSVYPDGSGGTYELTAISEGSEIKLTGHLGITSSLYGDYMVINSDGWLVFYDDQGYIYGVPPLK